MEQNKAGKLNWGIIGLGKMAHHFVQDLLLVDGATLEAVASRSSARADRFAREYGARAAYSDYHAILQDGNVDILYIATPHNSHMKLAIEAMRAGKHVLCEKPLAVNRHQAQKMIDVATKNKVFLMEALWTRFNPSIRDIFTRIQQGDLGEVQYINADFSFLTSAPDESRLFNPDLAGGALLDIGIYPLFLSYLILGLPQKMQSSSLFYKTGVDLQTSAILTYEKAMCNLSCGFNSSSDMIARIHGTKGSILIEAPWHGTDGYYTILDGQKTYHPLPKTGNGYTYEIEECMTCITQGLLESPGWTHKDSLALISLCDRVREQVGLIYPFEKES
jgi:predicted dehydrogenase